jgi:hypothetical protein
MESIGTIAPARTRVAHIWLAMIAFTVALLLVTIAGAPSISPGQVPEPAAGHTVCVAETVPGPCS